MGKISCIVLGCVSKTGEGLSLFKFPNDIIRARAWLTACNREDLVDHPLEYIRINFRICERHFEQKYMSTSNVRKHLFMQAEPTIFTTSKHKVIIPEIENLPKKNHLPEMSEEIIIIEEDTMNYKEDTGDLNILPEEFNALCRSCLNKNGLINIFETRINGLLFKDMLTTLSEVTIEKSNNLPKKICYTCAQKCLQFLSFGKLIRKSHLTLENIIRVIPTEQIDHHIEARNNDKQISPNISRPNDIKMNKDQNNIEILVRDDENIDIDANISFYGDRYEVNNDSDDICDRTSEEYQCGSCDKSFSSLTESHEHTNQTLCGEVQTCHKKLSAVDWKTHSNQVQDNKPTRKYFQCHICERMFKTTITFRKHMKQHRTVEDYRCKGSLKSEKVLYKCKTCNKYFTAKLKYLKHVMSHTGEKPYPCTMCEKRYTHQTHLADHTKRVHSVERPFVCSYCNKTFNNSATLKIHLRIHTKEWRCICDICGKGFYTFSNMNKHKKIHNKNNSDIDNGDFEDFF